MLTKKTLSMQNPGYSLKSRQMVTKLACKPFTDLSLIRSSKIFFKHLF